MERQSTDNSFRSKCVRRSRRKSPASSTTKRIRRNSATGSDEKDGTHLVNPESAEKISRNEILVSTNISNGMKSPKIQYLKFHAVHGKNVSLNATRTKASRNKGVNSLAYVFVDHVLKVEEKIYIKISRTSSEINGNFSYGFTSCDPSTLNPQVLPENADELLDRTEYWIVQDDTHSYEAGDYFFCSINTRGEVSVGKNSSRKSTVFHVDPSLPLWLFFNMVGSVTKMKCLSISSTMEIALQTSETASRIPETSRSSISSPAIEMASQTSATSSRILETSNPNFMSLESTVKGSHHRSLASESEDDDSSMDISSALNFNINQIFSFHAVHGKNVTLNSHRTIASRNKGFNSLAYVFTENTFKLEDIMYVKILRTNPEIIGSFLYGITSCNPSTLTPHVLPENADDLLDRPEYWIVEKDSNFYEAGDVITYSISTGGEVTVMKNCVHKSAVFHVDPTQPLWLFFNILGSVSEIKLLEASISNSVIRTTSPTPNVDTSNGTPGTSGEQTECVVCFEEQVNCAVYRCGHMCMRYSCASKMKNSRHGSCPICRKDIEDVIRIYK